MCTLPCLCRGSSGTRFSVRFHVQVVSKETFQNASFFFLKCKPAFAFFQEFTPSPFLISDPKALTKMLLSQNDKFKVLYNSYVREGLVEIKTSMITRNCVVCSTTKDYFFSTRVPFCSSVNDIITEEPQEKGMMWEVCAPAWFWSLDQGRWSPEQGQGGFQGKNVLILGN